MVECGYFEQIQTDIAGCVDPFLCETIASRCNRQIPVVFPIDITTEIASHGNIGGPPCPVDLRTSFDFGGVGSCVVLTWRPGAVGTSVSEVDGYEVQMSRYEFIETDSCCLIDKMITPFVTVTSCRAADENQCLITVKHLPSSVLQFRLRAVSTVGVCGAWSTVSSICTPHKFRDVFQFESPFDKNGLLYWLGTNKGTEREYTNPLISGEVAVTASTSQGSLHILVSHEADGSFCISHNRVHSWMCLDIGENRYLEPTHYCLRSAKGETWKLRNWELHARVAKTDKWIVLSKHKNCTALAASSFSVAHFPISHKADVLLRWEEERSDGVATSTSTNTNTTTGATAGRAATTTPPSRGVKYASPSSMSSEMMAGSGSSEMPGGGRWGSGPGDAVHVAFRYFRILQKGVNSSGDNFLVCNGIELYGLLHDEPVLLSPPEL
jgi:hypothetical protein